MSKHQKELAKALGLSEGQVSKLKRKGMPTHSVEAAQEWRAANVGGYVRTPQEPAGAPSRPEFGAPSPAHLNLGQERAALARAQRLAVEMRMAVASGEFAPVKLLAQVLATASQAVAERFDHLPGELRKRCPDMTEAQRDAVVAVIAAARNEWVRSTADLVVQRLESTDDETPEDEAMQPPSEVTE